MRIFTVTHPNATHAGIDQFDLPNDRWVLFINLWHNCMSIWLEHYIHDVKYRADYKYYHEERL